MEKVTAIIVAGGSGKRMGMAIKKQYIELNGKAIIAHTLEAFEQSSVIDEIIVVVAKEEIERVNKEIVAKYKLEKVKKIVAGGTERQDSVYNGLLAVDEETKYVMIHDGARPFIKQKTLVEALNMTKEKGATIVAVPVKDTIKIVESGKVEDTPKRDKLWAIQTPQSFEKQIILDAYSYAKENNILVTDDSMLVEAYGKEVYVVQGDYTNIKITTPEDLIIGKAFMSSNTSSSSSSISSN